MARKVTQLSSNYIKLDLLPKRKDGKIDWMKSCGCNVDFRYCNIIDTLKIEKVERKNNITYITVSYENNSITLQQGNFTKCRLGKLLSINNSDDVLIKWKYEIGDNVVDDLYVLDRKIINHRQCYKISCKKCNFKSQSYYVVKNKELKHFDEYWIDLSSLRKITGCPCCCKNKSFIVVAGINDIATTDSWMLEYFVDKSYAYKLSSSSNFKILMQCKDCKTERLYSPSNLKTYGYLPCVCRDGYSIPNKFSYFLFSSMKNLKNYEREYSPDWLKPYRYDNYFELNNDKYVIEMDGGLGHGKKIFGSDGVDFDGLNKDIKKDNLAREHGIKVIRVNSDKSDLYYLRENILQKLSCILDFSDVNWDYVFEKSASNIIKNVCEYANQNYCFNGYKCVESKYILEISNNFNMSKATVVRFLKFGRNFGWCKYITYQERAKIIEEQVYEIYQNDRNKGYEDIAKILNIKSYDVANATKKLIRNNQLELRRKRNNG